MSIYLLNTAEAARYLRVSQASVRRWSDSGLLQARRVGRRRERRFSEEDLKSFMTPGSSSASGSRVQAPGEVTVGGTRVPIHTHLATFYDSDEGRLRLTVPFFRDALVLGQPCYLAASGHVLDAYLSALREISGIDVDTAIRSGKFITVGGPGSTVDAALRFWDQALSSAVAEGATLLRVVGEMVSELEIFKSDDEMIRYEVAFNIIARRFPTVTLCQYDVRAFSGETVYRALRAHPDLYDMRIAGFLN